MYVFLGTLDLGLTIAVLDLGREYLMFGRAVVHLS